MTQFYQRRKESHASVQLCPLDWVDLRANPRGSVTHAAISRVPLAGLSFKEVGIADLEKTPRCR